ncbi:hypothetical protein M426DRAFT_18318 [Hypoxylon sp. CI-4A]|nr:hypothetical protein M426DRAFT_18318 [Hypoxylon sp. CI-4A]
MMITCKFVVLAALAVISGSSQANALCRPPPPELNVAAPADNTHGLSWVIDSSKEGTKVNGKQVKLRVNRAVPGGFVVAVDDTSRALVTDLRDGGALFASTDLSGYLNRTGPTSKNQIVQYEFGFASVTPAFNVSTARGKVDESWELLHVSAQSANPQFLSRTDFTAQHMGFTLCPQEGGKWFQVFFMVSWSGETWDNGCENVGLQTNVTLSSPLEPDVPQARMQDAFSDPAGSSHAWGEDPSRIR